LNHYQKVLYKKEEDYATIEKVAEVNDPATINVNKVDDNASNDERKVIKKRKRKSTSFSPKKKKTKSMNSSNAPLITLNTNLIGQFNDCEINESDAMHKTEKEKFEEDLIKQNPAVVGQLS
jgi:hypothetical protein